MNGLFWFEESVCSQAEGLQQASPGQRPGSAENFREPWKGGI